MFHSIQKQSVKFNGQGLRWTALLVIFAVLVSACAASVTPTQPPTDESQPSTLETTTEPTPISEPTQESTAEATVEALEPYISPRETIDVVPSPKVIGYFSSWGIYGRNYHVKHIVTSGAAENLHVINYAFGGVFDNRCILGDPAADHKRIYGAADGVDGVPNGKDALKGHFGQLLRLKQMYPDLKVLIAVGGWTLSAGFSDAALAQNRESFVRSCIDMFIKGDLPGLEPGTAAGVFDGIDIDWEYPAAAGRRGNTYRPEDTQNFTLLLAEFRHQLDEIDPNLMLTIASPAGEDKYSLMELDKIHPYLDWINIMTYDYHGRWDAEGPTNFNAPLYANEDDPSEQPMYIDHTVRAYIDAGVPPQKLTLGVPFYGHGWTGVSDENNGLYQPAEEPAIGLYEAGINDYSVLAMMGWPDFYDPDTQGHWIYDGTTFWGYDDPQSVSAKMEYVREMGLGGAMIWELAGDSRDGELLSALYNALMGE